MDKKRDTYSIVSTLTSTKYLIGLMFTLHGSPTKKQRYVHCKRMRAQITFFILIHTPTRKSAHSHSREYADFIYTHPLRCKYQTRQ